MKIYHSEDLWTYLQKANKTVVMYGMGNGADKILNICDRYGIEVADFFASDGFVRGHSFRGMLVRSFSEIKEKYGDNQLLIQQATMELYKKEKINPASGCLPMFIQIPVFFSLYKVLNIAIEIRHAPFVGWIKDLSAPDPLTLSQILHIYVPSFMDIGLWPIFMGLTMWVQQKLNPAPTNKDQAKMFAIMPIFFTFMLGHFASGLVIYWTLSNILSIIQQKVIMHKNGVK